MHDILPLEVYKKAEQGDKQARNQIVENHIPLVHKIAKRYSKDGYDYEDLIQEGAIALIRAVEKFDWRKGYGFSTYATWWLRHKYDAIIKKRELAVIDIDEWFESTEMEVTELAQTTTLQEDLEQSELSQDVRKEIMKLPPKQRASVILKHGLLGFNQTDNKTIADVLKTDKRGVKDIVEQAEDALRSTSISNWL